VLRVNGNQISNFHGLVTPLDKLNELYAHDNVITDIELLPTRCPQLESIDLRNNQITSSSQVAVLGECEALQDIWLQGNPCCFSPRYATLERETFQCSTDGQLKWCLKLPA
jgi:Leucine-rich repeat (LRR) protein